MPFGLKNAGATFQRAMDVAFSDFINLFLVIYHDDMTTYSKREEDHCENLEKVFIRALEYGISLNPKKCLFGVLEGKLLGHIVSKDGVKIDSDKVIAIDKVPQP